LHRHGFGTTAAMMFNDPLSGLGIGISVPAAFMIATVLVHLLSRLRTSRWPDA
jgi:hypothetical protein